MKYKSDTYESDILEMIHESKMIEFQLGLITEARLREYDELCLTKKALRAKKHAQRINTPETVKIDADLVTA